MKSSEGVLLNRDGPPSTVPPGLINTPDAEPKVEPIKQGGPNKPYVVFGQSYEPMALDVPWKQRGIASWYGQKFHGRSTASGELYSQFGMTAAHRTLPIPSYVRVRHVASGKEVIVRVNDRGPFHSSRILDLSYTAALKLGILAAGSAEVELERLTFEDIRTGAWRRSNPIESLDMSADPLMALVKSSALANSAPTTEPPVRAYTPASRGFWVQLAALGKKDGIDQLQQRLSDEFSALVPFVAVFKDSTLFRLQVGPYESREQADGVARAVKEVLALTPLVIEKR